MKKTYRWLVLITLVLTCEKLLAQEEDTDSTKVLDEVVIQAYRSDRPLSEVPVSIGVITEKELNRFSNTSLLPAVNMVPGVRMEERSPGSYRFSVRGSVLRSPFGVRNVKFYWKGLPLTDGGGNTYLNLLDFNSIGNMEIIKGPGASLYGAGTGGVVLLDPPKFTRKMNLDYSMLAGTFGLWRFQAGGTVVTSSKSLVAARLAYQQSNGYREQTKMSRFMAQVNWDYRINNKNTLSTTVLASDLDYQTPGGLTLTQFEQDPHQARPAGGPFRGAVEQKAAVSNRTVYAGTVLEHDWNDNWSTRVGLFGSGTLFENPTIRNYEVREEQNWGGRTETQVHFGSDPFRGKLTFGGEFQQFFSPLAVYDNDMGTKGNLQTDDYLRSTSGLFFLQTELDLPYQFFLTLGGSANFLKYDFKRLNVSPQANQERKFEPGFFPRVALLKKISQGLSLYGSLSNGFSAPSLEEVRPSTGSFVNGVASGFNDGLNPEHGSNMELGIRLNETKSQLHFDLAAYKFQLKETIVIQRAADGGDYFVNAGTTDQRGLEGTLSWTPRMNTDKWNDLRLWVGYTMNDYHFKDYVNDGNDYSGNMITGVPPYVFVAGLSLETKRGWYALITFNHTDRIPLNDANGVFASEYDLLGARAGKKLKIKKLQVDLFIGVDNALDERYSLGNDLNAPLPAGRYYNAAAPRNYYGGLAFPLFPK